MSKSATQRYLELLSRFPLGFQYRLAAVMAWFLARTPNQVSRQLRENIALCFAQLDQPSQDQLYHDAMRHTCCCMTELAAVWCWPAEKVLQRITRVEVCEEFRQSTRGRIILAPHLGSWETLALWLSRDCSAMLLYKRRKNKSLDAFIKSARARNGGQPIPTKKHGLRQLLIGLKKGGSVMILPDQKPASNKAHIESSFFGHDAPTTTLVQNLCAKIDCDVFLASSCRSDPPGEFQLEITALDHVQLAGDEVESAQYMNNQIETLVKAHLAQYQWGYRRFSQQAYKPAKQGT